jgi:dynein heavy chain
MLEIPTVCTEAIKMLRTWKDAYYDTRLKIEKSGKEQKWEFDKNKLFKETDYIAAVASDLFDMAQVYTLLNCRATTHSIYKIIRYPLPSPV